MSDLSEKDASLFELINLMGEKGISFEDLSSFQTHQEELKEEPQIRPSDLAGVSNVVSKSNEELTSELASLTHQVGMLKSQIDIFFASRHNTSMTDNLFPPLLG